MMREPSSLQRQRGIASILGVLFMGAAVAIILFQIVLPILRDFDRQQAALRAGNYLAQYNAAIRQFYGFYGVASVPTGTRTGSDWLKSATECFGGSYSGSYSPPEPGNPSQGFLPCEFPSTFPFGVTPSTTLAVTSDVFTATTTVGPFTNDELQVDYLVGVQVMQAAQAERWVDNINVTDAFFGYTIENNPASGNFGRITATATNNYSLTEIYLPRDGRLPMLGELDMGGNDINNVRNIAGTGSLALQQDVMAGRDVLAANRIGAQGDVVTFAGNVVARQGDVVAAAGDIVAPSGRVMARGTIESVDGNVVARDGYIRDVVIDGRAARMSQAVFDKRVVPSQSQLIVPQCPGGVRPLLFAVPEAYASDNVAATIHGASRRITPLGGNLYQFDLLLLVTEGGVSAWKVVAPQYGFLNISSKCP